VSALGAGVPFLAVLALLACSNRARPSGISPTPDAAAVTPATDLPPPEPRAAVSEPAEKTEQASPGTTVPITAALAVLGKGETPLPRDGGAVVDPATAFRVEIATQLTDGRLALHDEQDVMVASTGTSEVGNGWTRFTLTPDEPLRPGSLYLLRVDGSSSRDVHDPAGRAYEPVEIRLRVTGERPVAPPRKKKRRAHRHGEASGRLFQRPQDGDVRLAERIARERALEGPGEARHPECLRFLGGGERAGVEGELDLEIGIAVAVSQEKTTDLETAPELLAYLPT
jgi:hypothetical protein